MRLKGDRARLDMGNSRTNFTSSFKPDRRPPSPVRVREPPTHTIKGDPNVNDARRFTTSTNDANQGILNGKIPPLSILPKTTTAIMRNGSHLAEGTRDIPEHQQPRETIAQTSMQYANQYPLKRPPLFNETQTALFKSSLKQDDGKGVPRFGTTQQGYAGAVARRPPAHLPAKHGNPLNQNEAYVVRPAVPITYTHFRGARGPRATIAVTPGQKGQTHIRDGGGERTTGKTMQSTDYRRYLEGGPAAAKPDFTCHVAPWHTLRNGEVRAKQTMATNSTLAYVPQNPEPRNVQLEQMRMDHLKKSFIRMPRDATRERLYGVTTNREEIPPPFGFEPTAQCPRQHTGSVIIR